MSQSSLPANQIAHEPANCSIPARSVRRARQRGVGGGRGSGEVLNLHLESFSPGFSGTRWRQAGRGGRGTPLLGFEVRVWMNSPRLRLWFNRCLMLKSLLLTWPVTRLLLRPNSA